MQSIKIEVVGLILTAFLVLFAGLSGESEREYRLQTKDPLIEAVNLENTMKKRASYLVYLEKPILRASGEKIITLSFRSDETFSFYELYRGDGENYKSLGMISPDKNKYIDTEVEEGKTYSYKIRIVYVGEREVKSGFSDEVKVTIPRTTELGLPDIKSSCKTYAYYTAVTMKSSPQYKLLNGASCYTDPDTGIRMVDDCYCVAMGSFYGTKIGTKYKITLNTGKTFNVILCDSKQDRHTNSTNQYGSQNKDILEFYVERSKIPSKVGGDYNVLPQFNGWVSGIERIDE